VLPAYNEVPNIRPIYDAIRSALPLEDSIEVIFVDDAPPMLRRTLSALLELRARRFGWSVLAAILVIRAALFAGLEKSRGTAVITMDCDLQHPPALLPAMIDAWRGGAKAVQMIRTDTSDAGFCKAISSKWFYKFLNLLSETPVAPAAADFQLLDRRVVDSILHFKDRSPFLRGLVGWLGYPSTRIEYIAAARHAGTSRYTLRKMVRLSVQAVTLSSKPLRLSFYLGLAAVAVSLVYTLFALVEHLNGVTVPGWTSVIVVVTFLGAIQLVSFGIMGEYIARIYEQSRGMPRSVVVDSDEDVPQLSSSARQST
jgi:dolichol-phosphate mannosyltransferase